MIRRPPRSTRTDTLFPYTTLFRSSSGKVPRLSAGQSASAALDRSDEPGDDNWKKRLIGASGRSSSVGGAGVGIGGADFRFCRRPRRGRLLRLCRGITGVVGHARSGLDSGGGWWGGGGGGGPLGGGWRVGGVGWGRAGG